MADLIVHIETIGSGMLIERITDGERRHFIRTLNTGEETSPESLMALDYTDELWPKGLRFPDAMRLIHSYEIETGCF